MRRNQIVNIYLNFEKTNFEKTNFYDKYLDDCVKRDEHLHRVLMLNGYMPESFMLRVIEECGEFERYLLAGNKSLTNKVFELLSKDGSYIVREAVADNPKTPECLLKKLVNEHNGYSRVGELAKKNLESRKDKK